jgi:hypothetical protein
MAAQSCLAPAWTKLLISLLLDQVAVFRVILDMLETAGSRGHCRHLLVSRGLFDYLPLEGHNLVLSGLQYYRTPASEIQSSLSYSHPRP